MRILVCLDDTDNLESRGTGELAALLAGELEDRGWGRSDFITRHQLLVDPAIPYTSHNSAMCFGARLGEGALPRFIDHAGRFLERESAPGSDPGLCVAVPARLDEAARLVGFGRSAKERVLVKDGAYGLARELGIHLSEHGGSGQGVIGALAGVGLRLGGNDGRLKGHLQVGAAGAAVPIRALLDHPLIEEIESLTGEALDGADLVRLDDKVKTVLRNGRSVLLVVPAGEPAGEARWRTCSRRELKEY